MQETFQEISSRLQDSLILSLCIALITGIAADKTVASGIIAFMIIGLVGLFLGQFMLIYLGLQDYLENISEFESFSTSSRRSSTS